MTDDEITAWLKAVTKCLDDMECVCCDLCDFYGSDTCPYKRCPDKEQNNAAPRE
jgi:hypothetical protein